MEVRSLSSSCGIYWQETRRSISEKLTQIYEKICTLVHSIFTLYATKNKNRLLSQLKQDLDDREKAIQKIEASDVFKQLAQEGIKGDKIDLLNQSYQVCKKQLDHLEQSCSSQIPWDYKAQFKQVNTQCLDLFIKVLAGEQYYQLLTDCKKADPQKTWAELCTMNRDQLQAAHDRSSQEEEFLLAKTILNARMLSCFATLRSFTTWSTQLRLRNVSVWETQCYQEKIASANKQLSEWKKTIEEIDSSSDSLTQKIATLRNIEEKVFTMATTLRHESGLLSQVIESTQGPTFNPRQ